jgi:prepilin-type N-terminal cleavage/methylation domain-containing protein/prepilin-type processing-associated H-X9-DG protein
MLPDRRNFTLVELLCVIAVVAILMALLFPSLAYSRHKAKVVSCASQYRQWGIASFQFAAQNDQKLPRHDFRGTGRNAWDVGNGLLPALEKFGLNWELWFCPVAGRPDGGSKWVSKVVVTDRSSAWKYMHRWDYFTLLEDSWWVPRRSGTVLFPPGHPTRLSSKEMDLPILSDNASSVKSIRAPELAKKGHQWRGRLHSVNALFLDGHVQSRYTHGVRFRYAGNYNNYW